MEIQAEAQVPPDTDAPPMSALEQYAAYPFGSDQEYQQGLASILLAGSLNNTPSPAARDEFLRRTRVFYFNKVTGSSLSMDEARDYERALKTRLGGLSPEQQSPSPDSSPPPPQEPRILSFSELKELMESGRLDQVPNNKTIPEKFSEEPPSQSTAAVRKKPWEALQSPQAS